MFGLRRKSDGFEWREYVRTTVLLRRKDRRDRVIGARDAAVAGARQAGAVGAKGLVQFMKTAGSAAAAAPRRIAKGLSAGLGPLAAKAGRSLDLKALSGALAPIGLLAGAAAVVVTLHAVLGKPGGSLLPTTFTGGPVVGWAAVIAVFAAGVLLLRRYAPTFQIPVSIRNALKPVGALTGRVTPPMRFGLAAVLIALPAGWLGWNAWRGTPPAASIASVGIPFIAAAPIEGRASAVSGDVLKLNGRELRLSGIEAPAREQRCVGVTGSKWRCGEAATEALSKALRNRKIICQPGSADEAGRTRATCLAGNEDIGARLVREGAVFAAAGMFASYAAEERDARSRKVGVWRGASIERPAEWRAKLWETARKAAPDGCPIKGQVSSSGRKTYLVPWSADYDGARVRTSRGERWFCSEAEATSAGFKTALGS